MENFNFHVPTDTRLGKDRLDELPAMLDQFGKNVLFVYGGGNTKRNGLYQQIIDLARRNGHTLIGLSGVEPNPRTETVKKGIELCEENQVDVILVVGGGSTIDCSRAVAVGFYPGEDTWTVIAVRKGYTGPALPIVTILTLAATGNEMNAGAVVSNLETNQKLGFGGSNMTPKVSFLDLTNTFTVPQNQTVAGLVDIFSHLIRNYFSISTGTDVQDFMPEGLMRMVIKNCPIVLENPEDYDAHANLMWASSLALSGLARCGKQGAWSCRPMEHELSAFCDITHRIGLAVLTPRQMNRALSGRAVGKFTQLVRDAWGIVEQEEEITAKKGIQALYDYFVACGILMTLSEVGTEADKLEETAQQAVAHNAIAEKAYVPLDVADIAAIYKDRLTESRFI